MRALLVVVLLLLGLAVVADRVARRASPRTRSPSSSPRKGGLHGTPDGRHRRLPVPHPGGGRPLRRRPHLADRRPSSASRRAPAPTSPCTACTCRCPACSPARWTQVPVDRDRRDGDAVLRAARRRSSAATPRCAREGDGLRITKTVEVLGQTLPLTAAGTVTLDGQPARRRRRRRPPAPGSTCPGFLVDRVSDLLDLRYDVPALPFGLQLTGVTPADDGVRRRASRRQDTVLGG